MVYSYKWEFFPLNKENSRGCVCAYVHAKSFSHIQLFATLWMLLARFLCPLNSTGKNTGVGYHALLQRSFPIQGWTLHFLVSCNGRWVLHLPLVPPGKPFKGKENVFNLICEVFNWLRIDHTWSNTRFCNKRNTKLEFKQSHKAINSEQQYRYSPLFESSLCATSLLQKTPIRCHRIWWINEMTKF